MKYTFLLAIPALLLAACGAPEEKKEVSLEQTEEKVDLSEQMIENRAMEAVVWGLPAVNFEIMLKASEKIGGGSNAITYWSEPLTSENQLLTPNPNVIYILPFMDTKEVGPMVLEVPPADGMSLIVGSIDDVWQTPLTDLGVGGADDGKGAKYLILPPNYDKKIPKGYIVLESLTYKTYGLLRSNITEGNPEGVAKAVEYTKRLKLYPLSEAGNNPETKFVDGFGDLYEANIPWDITFFESLDRIIQTEPWLTRDKVMINMLEYIGMKKGKEFNPNAKTKVILERAVVKAEKWIENELEKLYLPFNKGKHWSMPLTADFASEAQSGYTGEDVYPVDCRSAVYKFVFFFPKVLGGGQFYLFAIKDENGLRLDGGKKYKLTVPKDVPVNQYWSAVAYNKTTHSLMRSTSKYGVASNMEGLQYNEDGSIDLYFGTEAPEGLESNWIPTEADNDFEMDFRFYGIKPGLLDKTWVLNDLELIK